MSISELGAVELRRKWGDKPCNHPNYEYERSEFGGQKTGDVIGSQWRELVLHNS
jgi:hypothetical protein